MKNNTEIHYLDKLDQDGWFDGIVVSS